MSEAQAVAEPKAAKEVKPKTRKITVYTLLREVAADEKLNPQQAAILEKALPLVSKEGKIRRDELLAQLDCDILKTRQKPNTVLSFYMSQWKKNIEKKDKEGNVVSTIPALFDLNTEEVPA